MWVDLLKTWLIELPLLFLFLRRYDRPIPILVAGALISASTWPFLVYYYHRFGGNLFLLEVPVALIEGCWVRYLWKVSWTYSFIVSFTCNAVSFGLGWMGWI